MSASPSLTVLASFNNSNGAHPWAGLISDAAGDLFGTTADGGANNDGTVFELMKSGSGYSAPVTLASFNGSNGANPWAGLISDAAGDLFGTTADGGANNDGTVFELMKSGSGYSAPVTLASFNGSNGAHSGAGLISDAAGDLFGTTEYGGAYGYGTVFELVKSGSGYSAPVTLVAFLGTNGAYPRAGLISDAAGDLFGTTESGGANNGKGTVFELVNTGSGYSNFVTLATFTGSDGSAPQAGLISDAAGDLFGTTRDGGANNHGTVFEIVKSSSGYSAPVTLADFNGTNIYTPEAGLIIDAVGDLFGTTYQGGKYGDGTVFELVKSGSGYSAPVTLVDFNGFNAPYGAYPEAGLISDAAGDLFGTTSFGAAGDGTVFEITNSGFVVASKPTLAIASAALQSNQTTVSLSGTIDTAAAGQTISIYDGATLLGTSTASTADTWSASVTVSGQSVHTLTAQASNSGGTGTSNSVVDLVNASTSLSGGGQIVLFSGSGDAVTLSATGGTYDTVTGSGGTITLDNAQALISGSDTVNITGDGDSAITAGSGSDTINVSGNGNNTIIGGSGGGTISITGTGTNTIQGGSGGTYTITLGSGSDIISALGAGSFSIKPGPAQELGGLNIKYEQLTLENDVLLAAFSLSLPFTGGSITLDTLPLGLNYGLSFSDAGEQLVWGASAAVPDLGPVNVFGIFQGSLSNASVAYIAASDTLKLQGNFTASKILGSSLSATVNFSGNNFIQWQNGTPNFSGNVSITGISTPTIAGKAAFGIKEIDLGVNTVAQTFSGGIQFYLPFGVRAPEADVSLKGNWVNGPVINEVDVSASDLGIALPTAPEFIWQSASLAVSNMFNDAAPTTFSGSLGFSFGPQISGQSIGTLSLSGSASSQQLTGSEQFQIVPYSLVSGLTGSGLSSLQSIFPFVSETGTVTANFAPNGGGFQNFTFNGTMGVFGNFITLNQSFKADADLDFTLAGSASVNFGNSLFGKAINLGVEQNANYLISYTNGAPLTSDFAEAWGTTTASFIGLTTTFTIGVKTDFEGDVSVLFGAPSTAGAQSSAAVAVLASNTAQPAVFNAATPAADSYLFITDSWTNAAPGAVSLSLTTPGGTTISQADFAANNIAIVSALSTAYSETVAILNPSSTTGWSLQVTNPAGLGTIAQSTAVPDAGPSLQGLSVASVSSAQALEVQYNLANINAASTLSFFADQDGQNFDGVLLGKNTSLANGAGSTTVNLNNLGTGTWYVYWLTSDGVSEPQEAYVNSFVDLVNATGAVTGGGQLVLFSGSGDAVTLSATANNWDYVTASNGTIDLNGAQTSVAGGGDTINFLGSPGNAASLYNTAGNWDYINGSAGTVYLTNAQTSVAGGGDTVNFLGSPGNAASLYNTAGSWDVINGSNGAVYLTNAQTSVAGGGDTVNLLGSSGNAASLYNTAGNWDYINGSGGTVYLTNAQTSVAGGGDTVNFLGSSGNAASLYNTAGNWDYIDGSGGTVYLTNAQTSVAGGGDTVNFLGSSGNAASLYNTAGNWDYINGSGGTVYLTNAQTSVAGGGDTVNFLGSSGNAASLYNTAGNWDYINGSGGTVYLTNAQTSVAGGGDTIDLLGSSGNAASLYNTAGTADTINGSNGSIYLTGAQASVTGNSNTLNFLGTGNTATVSGSSDAFVFQAAFGQDAINGFASSDTMQFAASDFANWSALLGHMTQSGSNTLITLDASDKITLTNVAMSSLQASQFHFV